MNAFKSRTLLSAVAIVVASTATTYSDPIQPGYDLWTTPPGGAIENFGSGAEPIPADFFGPGSDPFFGSVLFQGQPLETHNGQPTGSADTIVQRPGPANLPANGSTTTIPIEIVALSLTSIDPIVVTYNGGQNPTLFDVEVTLGPNPSNGSMTVTRNTSKGGTYDATINVCPIFVFTQVGNPIVQFSLDYCGQVNPAGRPVSVEGQGWEYDIKQPQVSPLSGPNFVVLGPTKHDGPHPTAEPVERAVSTLVPAANTWGLAALLLTLVGLGAWVMRRRVA